MTPTARSLDYCRKHDLTAGIVERWNPHSRTRHDLMGFADLIVLDQGAIAVQVTTSSNAAARVKKILAEPRAKQWLENGCRAEVWAWSKRKVKRGGKAVRWELERRAITLADFV